MNKADLIKSIFKSCKVKDVKYFDIYNDKDDRYLQKLHTVITNWRAV